MFDWLKHRGQTWDTRYRIALYKRDYPALLAIALAVRSRKDFDYVLTAQSSHAGNPDTEAAAYFRAIHDEARRRFPDEETLHLRALIDLATALGPCEEGIAAAERVYAAWERIGVPLDSQDPWPKQDPWANRARYRLSQLYRQAGRAAEAAGILPLSACRHLQPVVEYLEARGVKSAPTCEDDGRVILSVDAVLDLDALGKRFGIAPPVEAIDYFDGKGGYSDLGFHCTAHLTWLLGTHYQSLEQKDPRRWRENWFR